MSMRDRIVETFSRRLSRAVVTARAPWRLGRAAISFTFDDVPVSAATTGTRILEERGVRGSFYVCGALAGTAWDPYPLASLDQVAALSTAGHEIGCHTASHLRATDHSPSAYLADIGRNADILAPVVGELTTFAYPYGAIGLRHKLRVQDRFSVARGIHGGPAADSYDRGRLDASALEDASIDERGIDALIADAVRRKAWTCFYAHDVDPRPSRFGVSPDRLAYAVDSALAQGCVVDTVAGVAARNRAAGEAVTS